MFINFNNKSYSLQRSLKNTNTKLKNTVNSNKVFALIKILINITDQLYVN